MVWYVWVLLGVFFSSLERIIDKKLVINKERKLDGLLAAFYRNLAFYVFIIVLGLIGPFGEIKLFFVTLIIVWAFFHVFASIIYDYFLKTAEIVRYSSITFILPILLIFFDKYFFNIEYLVLEIIGVFVLVFGGYIVSLDVKKRKSVFSSKQWALLFFSFLIGAAQYVIFKHYNRVLGINEVSFFVSTWVFVILFFVIGAFLTKKHKILIKTATKNNFFGKTLVSKFFDALAGLFFLKAIAESTVSKVYALESVLPLMTLLLVLFIVKIIGIDMKESFDRKDLLSKLLGVMLLSIGTYLLI